jgi:RNA polymerase sigma-70 factor (ECF subfamily)
VDVPDAVAFETFYREHFTRVVRACFLVTLDRSAAEDTAQEAFARLWSRWTAISGPDHAGGFVFKTAMRLCKKRARRLPVERAPVADGIEEATLRRDVFEALARLPLRQRQAVVLRDWAGFSTSEVASFLGTKESTVRVHLARGREALRALLSAPDRR